MKQLFTLLTFCFLSSSIFASITYEGNLIKDERIKKRPIRCKNKGQTNDNLDQVQRFQQQDLQQLQQQGCQPPNQPCATIQTLNNNNNSSPQPFSVYPLVKGAVTLRIPVGLSSTGNRD